MAEHEQVSANTMDPQATPSSAIAMLDLPVGSVLTCDGQTIKLQRDDFIGISRIPSNQVFHLVAVRSGAVGTKREEEQGNIGAVTVGFFFSTYDNESLALAHKFDPSTEEVSSSPLDPVTFSSLKATIQHGKLEPHRLIPYENIVSKDQSEAWRNSTNFLSVTLLKRRGIVNGEKIVPGSYNDDGLSSSSTASAIPVQHDNNKKIIDGTSVTYPAIPVLDSRKDARHSRHLGTKKYLATLPPTERTALFLNSSPHDFVMESILRLYDNRWTDILGDIQLSYALFLNLKCLCSLEHW
jgi:hypothetical protein